MSEVRQGAGLPAVAARVALNVAAFRRGRGWSIDALAARAGVSRGAVIGLEKGRGNPSLATLAALADALGRPLTELLDGPSGGGTRVSTPDQTRRLWSGTAGGRGDLLHGVSEPAVVELWRWELRPGEEHRSDGHAPRLT